MKKAWVFLIVLALLAFSVPVFADMAPTGGTFTAWNWGNFFPVLKVGSNPATTGWGPPWDKYVENNAGSTGGPWGVDQEWTFGYSGKNYGYNGTLEFSMMNLGNASATWWGVWYKFFDIATVTLGAPRITDYEFTEFIEGGEPFDRYVNGEYSATLQLVPVTGVSLAATWFAPSSSAWMDADTGTGPQFDIGHNFAVGASYAIQNIGTVAAYFKTRNENSDGSYPADLVLTNPNKIYLSVGFDYTGTKGLNAVIQYLGNFANANDSTTSGVVTQGMISAIYTEGPVSFAVNLEMRLQQYATAGDKTSSFMGEIDPEYTIMGPWAIGVLLGYDDGNGVEGFDWWEGEFAGFEFWPYLKASFDNGSYLKIGFLYASGVSSGVAIPGNSLPGGTYSVQNPVYAISITYLWAF